MPIRRAIRTGPFGSAEAENVSFYGGQKALLEKLQEDHALLLLANADLDGQRDRLDAAEAGFGPAENIQLLACGSISKCCLS